ncbi:hypothetical protein ACFX13_012805 [Malus domestica]
MLRGLSVLLLQLSCWLWQLKPANVVIVAKQCPESIDRLSLKVPGTERHAHVDQWFDMVGPEQAEPPGHDGTLVAGDQENLVNTQMVKQPDKVANYVHSCVGRWSRDPGRSCARRKTNCRVLCHP